MRITDGPLPHADLRYISFGAGTQSTALVLMAAEGLVGPMPDAAIFADTGAEPASVYRVVEAVRERLPFPLHVVSRGNLRDDLMASCAGDDKRTALPPFFTSGGGMNRRQCTREYKIEPLTRKVRELLGLEPRQRAAGRFVVETWQGITTDEMQRMKAPRESWIWARYPLIEAGMTRDDCIAWMRAQHPDIPVAKSACTFCPYRKDAEWAEMRRADPEAYADAIAVDAALRERGPRPRMHEYEYVHRALMPLDEAIEAGPHSSAQLSMLDECDGMCGV